MRAGAKRRSRRRGGLTRRSAEVTPLVAGVVARWSIAFPSVSVSRAGSTRGSIRISHPSGSRRARQPEPPASSLPRGRHQKRDRCEGVSKRSHRAVARRRLARDANPTVAHAVVAHRTTSRSRCESNQSYELRSSTPNLGSRTSPAQPKTRVGSKGVLACITCHPARASLCASALRATIVLVLAALCS